MFINSCIFVQSLVNKRIEINHIMEPKWANFLDFGLLFRRLIPEKFRIPTFSGECYQICEESRDHRNPSGKEIELYFESGIPCFETY